MFFDLQVISLSASLLVLNVKEGTLTSLFLIIIHTLINRRVNWVEAQYA